MTQTQDHGEESAVGPAAQDDNALVSDEAELAAQVVAVERISDIERKLAVQVPWLAVEKRLESAYKELGQGVTLKGFRRGKVPRRLLEQMFGKHVHKEVSQQLMQETVSKAVEDQSLQAVSEPAFEEQGIESGAPFCYSATIQIVPEVEPKDYFGIEVQQRAPVVRDEDVEARLRSKQQEETQYLPIEGRNTQAGDVLLVDLMGKVGTRAVAEEDQLIDLSQPEREPIAGLVAQLTGIDPSDEELSLDYPIPGASASSEKAEQARLLVTIKDAKAKAVPDLDDDFAKDTGEAETLQGLRELIRIELLEEDNKRAREEAKQSLVRALVERNDVPVVPALVDRQLEQIVSLQTALIGLQGGQRQLGAADRAALAEAARPDAEHAVKSSLLLAAIAKAEGLQTEDAELEQRLTEIAKQRDSSVAKVRSEYAKENRLEGLKSSLLEEKTLELLMSKAKLSVAQPGADAGTVETSGGSDAAAEDGKAAAGSETETGETDEDA